MQTLKKNQAQLIAEAWKRHEADRLKVSLGQQQLRETLEVQFDNEMRGFMTDETFFQAVSFVPESHEALANDLVPKNSMVKQNEVPLVSEVYTNSQNVMKEAVRRGHKVGTPMSLETGWDFTRLDHRIRAKQMIMEEKPFCLVLAFPCGPFSPLQHLNSAGKATLGDRLEKGRQLMKFALELAEIQVRGGRHFILENPLPSGAWKELDMQKFLEEHQIDTAVFDQCRFGLKSLSGLPHRKATRVASSSPAVIELLDGIRCMRNHSHDPVIGGSRITARAGIYPLALARTMVEGVEKQFDMDFGGSGEVLVGEAEGDEDVDFENHGGAFAIKDDDDMSDVDEQTEDDAKVHIPQSVKLAVKRLHENTGHRSNLRLARALAIAGAPTEAIVAAKRHQCAICAERAPPKARIRCQHQKIWEIKCTLI